MTEQLDFGWNSRGGVWISNGMAHYVSFPLQQGNIIIIIVMFLYDVCMLIAKRK